MFIEERQIAIEKVLREEGKVRTRELSEMFQVQRTASVKI